MIRPRPAAGPVCLPGPRAEAGNRAGIRLAAMADPQTPPTAPEAGFLEALMDTDLYSMGAYFCDQNPELVEEIVATSGAIEQRGLRSWAAAEGIELEEAFGMLLTGLAVRYYKAVAI